MMSSPTVPAICSRAACTVGEWSVAEAATPPEPVITVLPSSVVCAWPVTLCALKLIDTAAAGGGGGGGGLLLPGGADGAELLALFVRMICGGGVGAGSPW